MNVGQARCQVGNGTLTCTIEDNKACITDFHATDTSLAIPEDIEGAVVCGIGRKAFLGNRSLQHIILPETIEWIGDWAFCNCLQLRRVEFPCRSLSLGKGLFANDKNLYEIIFESGEGKTVLPGRLLALAVTMLDAEYLLDMGRLEIDEWYGHFDNRLLAMLMEPAESALRDLVYCAEEDMGAKQEAYLEEQNRRKAYMALLRLTYPEMLQAETELKLKTCLLDPKGLQTKAAWDAVKGAYAKEQLLFCDILLKTGGIREENLTAVLEDLGDEFVELKAHLLKGWEQQKAKISVSERFKL